jgi:signal transduction histidine kinase
MAFTIASLITAIVSFSLGIFVYLKNTKSAVNKSWFILSLSVSIWSFGIFALHNSPDEAHALFWIRFMYCGAIFIPSSFLHLIFNVSGITRYARNKKIILATYIISIIFLILNFTPLFVKGVKPRLDFKYFTDPGILLPVYGLFYLSDLIYAFYKLITEFPRVSAVKRNQLKYILFAAIVGFGGGLSTFLPLANIKIFPFGYYVTPFYSVIVSYAIVKHRLMDIDIVIKKGAVYAYLASLIFVPCVLIIFFAQKFFFGYTNLFFSLLVLATLLLSSLVILAVKPNIEEYIEKRLFKDKYEYKKTVRELSKIIISFLDENELFKKAGNILTKELGTEKVSFFMLDREKRAYTLRASQKLRKPKIRVLPEKDIFFQWLQKKGKAVVKEEIEKIVNDPQIKPVVKTMGAMESEVCIPLLTRNELIGTVNLGHKRSGAMYSHEDLDLLTQFAAQASIALENARLYREMQQTHMLMRRTDRLASLGSLTANLAHEIRNPLATIRTFLDLFPQRYKDKEFRGDFFQLTSSELDRISTLVTQLLSFARPVKPDVKKGNVNQVLDDIIQLVTVEAKKRHVTIDTNLQEIHQALLDADQMKQVFINIFLNAFEAIKNRGRISVTTRDIKRNGMRYVQVEISDNGQGIPEKILEHIFDPFFTTKKKGGGLGLSISHQIVEEHNGTIEVESRAKKGTTFIVTIPCET